MVLMHSPAAQLATADLMTPWWTPENLGWVLLLGACPAGNGLGLCCLASLGKVGLITGGKGRWHWWTGLVIHQAMTVHVDQYLSDG